MDLDQLQSVRDRERQTDRLQQLRESFYQDAGDFVADLRAERDAAAAEADDPFDSPRVNRLTDRIRTAEQTLEAIYEKRVGKVVKAATFAAADLPAEAEGMTEEEADLFDTLVERIEANRARVLDQLRGDHAGEVPESAEDPDGGPTDAGDEAVPAADLMGEGGAEPEGPDTVPPDAADADDERPPPPPAGDDGESDPSSESGRDGGAEDSERESDDSTAGRGSDGSSAGRGSDGSSAERESGDPSAEGEAADAPGVDRQLVRITDDVGPILGVDEREYDLSADDVVTLPAANAEPLVERGAAEPLE